MLKHILIFLRLLRTGWVLIRHDALVPQEYATLVPWPIRFFGAISRIFSIGNRKGNAGERFANALEDLGPAYIKFGQILSTRGDMFDPEFAQELSRLKDKVPPFPTDKAEAMLAAEWGSPWTESLTSLSEPIAAASVAQVHKGILKTGETVAVKILRPNIQRLMTRDMDVINMVANLAHKFVPNLRRMRPKDFVKEARRAVMLELDLRLEAAAASELSEVGANTNLFRVPQIHWDLVGKNIMVMEWIDGLHFSDPAILTDPTIDREDLARKVIQSFLASTFEFGVFHADMHEGNLIVDKERNLVLLDFGILGRLGDAEIRFEIDTLYGFLQRDYQKIAEVHFDIGYVPPHHSVEEFASALRAVGEPIFGKKASDVSMAKVLLQLLEITEIFDMPMQPQLILLQKTMMQAEGVARRLDPEFDMWEAARPIVEKAVRRELGPEGIINDFLDGLDRTRKTLETIPGATENIAKLAQAWADGEIDLSRPLAQPATAPKQSALRPSPMQASAQLWHWVAHGPGLSYKAIMTNYPKSLDKMLAIWNSTDPATIKRLTEEALETNVHFVDPNYNIMGREAFIDMVHAVQKKIPGAAYSRVGNVNHHHNYYRYHWAIHMGDQLLMPGFDVTEVNDMGKIVKIIGFFGELD